MRALASLAIVVGIAAAGLALIAFFGLLPVDVMLSAETRATSGYLRAIPTAARYIDYLTGALFLGGLALSAAGLLFRHRLRSNDSR